MRAIDLDLNGFRIQGQYDTAFQSVLDAFAENFQQRNELGASVNLSVDGSDRVHLWGGFIDEARTKAWQEDTISLVFSCTKAATALCAHLLIDRGLLDLQAPVTQYWPEFATQGVAQGKDKTTVAMMLNHSAGLPALRQPVRPGGFYDWDYMIERLSNEEPFWEPGTRNGYHMVTFGWTVGELVRRASGKSLGDFFADEVAKPLGIDYWIGLPEAQETRVSPMIPWRPKPQDPMLEFTAALVKDRNSLQGLALLNNGGFVGDSRAGHAAQIGGGGGITNARGLAGMYRALACKGVHLGDHFISNDAITRMGQVSMATLRDATLLIATRFALGFMKSIDNRTRATGNVESVILGEKAFGHVGAGGSIGFADPECGLALGYSMNRMGAGILLNERGQAIVDAAYRSLGYRSNNSGVWA